ncbi:ABC transporter substrate-binding protein [Afifella pfennigii]|uniref:ABC transporter substrate-binding protein n=1 Tax=Afifella pfennigii TaxID=209897 RepID=UPI00047A3330|nr:glycine betaine ABC transporter substrate-binding protein [Afifella pfennigii]
MRLSRYACRFLAVAALAAGTAPAGAADVVVGVPHWPSAQVTANIIASLLTSELGVEAELEERGTLGILAGIDQGEMHIHPEVWLPNLNDAVDRYAGRNGTLRLSENGVAAAQNVCVTAATAQATGIDEVSDLADPAMAKHFDTNADGKGEMWIGAPSWSSTGIEKVRARSYGYDQTMTLLEGPEAVAMAAIDVAAAQGLPVVFYCYRPHHVFELHDIRILAEPAHDPATWSLVSASDDPSWQAKSKAGSAWDASHYHIAYAASLSDSHPQIAAFLERITLTPQDATQMSYAVEVERTEPAKVAEAWIAANRKRIEEWTQ